MNTISWRANLIQKIIYLLNKILKFHMLTVIVRYIFEDGKYYPQVFFRWMFVWIINVRIW